MTEDLNDLIRTAMKWDVKDEDMDIAIHDAVENGPEDFAFDLINGLLPLIETNKSELTGRHYKGFAVDGLYKLKTEMK